MPPPCRSKEGEARLPVSVDAAGGLLRFAVIDQSDGGRYVCEARNAAGTARATAEVIVQGTYGEASHAVTMPMMRFC